MVFAQNNSFTSRRMACKNKGNMRLSMMDLDWFICYFHTRVTVKAMCPMDLVKYPRDKQTCYIDLLSCEYDNF